ncbi:hypothetical protein LNTAR_12106 [Lentisphaera araneosa HTCC2155]|uniref:PA14 domain-containing protein n=1 Tax=Lentisphaera araneosa HTCC2155 TaxID=313628 RepID=A6DJM2_9BACT|nr:RHS repeat-associated core domain-containing protein [Lentisphaera araneosa]EDM28096.1 hypothetical protein LNTAR_12106 [Lentisphaera araneosa HTCC2155]
MIKKIGLIILLLATFSQLTLSAGPKKLCCNVTGGGNGGGCDGSSGGDESGGDESGGDEDPDDPGCDDTEDDGTDEEDDEAPDTCSNSGGSIIDNLTYNYIHNVTDFSIASGTTACASCGSSSPVDTLTGVRIVRYHQFRHMSEQGSFGPGVFINWDSNLTLFEVGDIHPETRIDFFEPAETSVRRYFKEGDVFKDTYLKTTDRMELYDTNGDLTTSMIDAQTAVVFTLSQRTFHFELYEVEEGMKKGRIVAYRDQRGYGIDLTYQIPANAQVNDPSEKRKIETISDDNNRQLTFTYFPTQKNSQWVVSSIQLPNGSAIQYNYGAGETGSISSINYPDGTSSTFSTSVTSDNLTKFSIFEAGEKASHRNKHVYLDNNFVADTSGQDGVVFFNSAALLITKLTKGDDEELAYQNFEAPDKINNRLVYEGGQQIKHVTPTFNRYGYLGPNATVTFDTIDLNTGYYDFDFKSETKFVQTKGSITANFQSRPTYARNIKGEFHTYAYNDKKSVTKKSYADGSSKKWQKNQFQQDTVECDREGRVTLKTYDDWGNLLSKKVGLSCSPQGLVGQEYLPGLDTKIYFYSSKSQLPTDFAGLPLLDSFIEHNFNSDVDNGEGKMAFSFDGQIEITNSGDYTFYSQTTLGGAKLYINDQLVVDNEAWNKASDEDAGKDSSIPINLSSGFHSIRVEFYTHVKYDELGLLNITYTGPDTLDLDSNQQEIAIPDTALTHLSTADDYSEEFEETSETATYLYEYYPAGHINQHLLRYEWDAKGNKTEHIYDENNQILEIREPSDNGSGSIVKAAYTYDSARRQTSSTDALGRTTAFEYDNRDRVIKVTYNDASTELRIYGTGADSNLIVKSKDRNGNTTKYTYDSLGRAIQTIRAYSIMNTDGSSETVNPPNLQSIENCTYVQGTELKASCTINGEKKEYEYDYRKRIVKTNRYPKNGIVLTSEKVYKNNKLLQDKSPYGHSTFYAYRESDSKLIRTLKTTWNNYLPSVGGEGFILSRTRDSQLNAKFMITDYELDATGLTTATIDPRGIRHEMVYDSRGRMIASTQAVGSSVQASTSREYDANSNVTASIDPRGIRTEMTYTARNLMASQTVAASTSDAATSYYTYYDDKRQNTVTDYKGNFSQSVWHQCCGRPQANIDQAGNGTITNNDFYGNITHSAAVEDVLAHAGTYHDPINAKTLTETTRLYDSRNRMVAQTVWLQPLGYVDPNNVPIATDSAQGLTTFYTYFDEVTGHPELASIIAELAADGIVIPGSAGGSPASDGSAVMVQNPAGELSVQISDGLGRSVASAILEPSNYSVITWNTTAYDAISANGLVETASIDALNNTSKSRADGAGRVQESVDALGNISTASYDANSNRISYRDASGVGQDCIFDARNRDVSCVDTAGSTTTKVFDANNNLVSVTDAKGQTSTYVYDLRNRKISQTDRIGGTTTFAYDANNNLTSITDAQASVTTYVYDLRNLQTSTIYPAGSAGGSTTVSTVYDALGRKAQVTDQLGDTVTYTYDMVSRMLNRDYSDNTSDTFTYDDASRLVSATKGRYSNTISYTYDQAGRRLSETQTHSGSAGVSPASFTISHTFDVANRVTSCTYPDGTVLNKTYTDRNLLEGLSYAGTAGGSPASVVDFTYDASMREASREYGNAITTDRTYNDDNTLGTLSSSSALSFTYAYDANKNVTGETVQGAPSSNSALSWTAAFDNEDRLSLWTRSGSAGGSPASSMSWNLDLIGNWSSVTRNGLTDTRTHNGVHELTGSAGGSPASYSYDAKGNLTTNKYGSTLTWDIDNHLQSILYSGMDPADAPSYEYDALGRRLSKSHLDGSKTLYVLCDQKVCMEFDLFVDGNTGALLPAVAHRKYVWGTYVDELIAIIPAEGISNTLYAHQDRQYNLRGLTDSNGALVEYYAYSPYGERTAYDSNGTEIDQTSTMLKTDYGFTGRRYDMESDLWYFRARYFDTEMGRFVSRDPLGYVDGASLYAGYFAQFLSVDPSGTKCQVRIFVGHHYETGRWIDKQNPKQCDAMGAVSCHPDGNNESVPEKNQIGGMVGAFDKLLRNFTYTKQEDNGYLHCKFVKQAIKIAVKKAIRHAKSFCKKEGGCCKNVRFAVICSTWRKPGPSGRLQKSAKDCGGSLCRDFVLNCKK